MLSKKAKYAIKALVFLGKNKEEGRVLISDIAEKERIPKKFLEQILLELRKHAILQSRRGKEGGYLLAKSPTEINMGQVIRIVDGPLAMIPCVSHLFYEKCEECVDEETCTIRNVLKKVRDTTAGILDNTTLQDLISGENYANKE
ncbi:MAG: hypothetical protein RLZZ175_2671 [Bacteroidota bacterium]|jgi:Rrf2 family protein